VKGFDEPWQFIYRRYEHWYDTGTIGSGTKEWVSLGIFSIFFTFALFGLIGMIVSKIRSTVVKSLFVDFIKIPKAVYEYGKRSKKKVFDHFFRLFVYKFFHLFLAFEVPPYLTIFLTANSSNYIISFCDIAQMVNKVLLNY
jgi:hypothetical protein